LPVGLIGVLSPIDCSTLHTNSDETIVQISLDFTSIDKALETAGRHPAGSTGLEAARLSFPKE